MNYKRLIKVEHGVFPKIIRPIQYEDRIVIREWRNAQMKVLRQNNELTSEEQDNYFENVVSKLYEKEFPSQMLWSYYFNDTMIGYGGLVHIDWDNRNAEVSFLSETSRSINDDLLDEDWSSFLNILKTVAFKELNLKKIYTYAYSRRSNLFPILEKNDLKLEATLKNHVKLENAYFDGLFHSIENNKYVFLTPAEISDAELFFKWRNEKEARLNSINTEKVEWENHKIWFEKKLNSNNVKIFKFVKNNENVGSTRIEIKGDKATISYSIDKLWRGRGLGKKILKEIIYFIYFLMPDIYSIEGVVKESNIASMKIFEGLKFEKHYVQDNLILYRRNLIR